MTANAKNRSASFGLCMLIAVMAGALLTLAFVAKCIYDATEAENNLHALVQAMDLLGECVERDGEWPRTWTDIARAKEHKYGDPNIDHLKSRVTINFSLTLNDVRHNESGGINGVGTIGHCYEAYQTQAAHLMSIIQKAREKAR